MKTEMTDEIKAELQEIIGLGITPNLFVSNPNQPTFRSLSMDNQHQKILTLK